MPWPWLTVTLTIKRLLQLVSQGQKRCALAHGRKTWERSWDNRLPACRQDRVQQNTKYGVAPGALAAIVYIYIYTNLYLIHLLCMPSFILVGSLALCSLLKNVNDSKGFSSCGKDTLQELMFATDVLCARGPRKRTRSQSTEGSRAGGPFLA